jgi:hypothetical protein
MHRDRITLRCTEKELGGGVWKADVGVQQPIQLGGRVEGPADVRRRGLDDRAARRRQPVEPLGGRQVG